MEKEYKKYSVLKERRTNLQKNINGADYEIKKLDNEIKKLKEMMQKLPSLEKDYLQIKTLQIKLNKLKPLKEKFDAKTQQLGNLNAQKTEKEKVKSDLTKQIVDSSKIIVDLEKIIPKQNILNNAKREQISIGNKKTKLQSKQAELKTELTNISQQLIEIEEKQKQVKGQKKCPVCLRNINDPSQIELHYKKEKDKLLKQQNQKRTKLKAINAEQKVLDEKLRAAALTYDDLQKRFSKKDLLKREKTELKTSKNKLMQTLKAIHIINQSMEKINGTILNLNFDEITYKADEDQLNTLNRQKASEKYVDAKTQIKTLPKVNKKNQSLEKLFILLEQKAKNLDGKLFQFGDIESRNRTATNSLKIAEEEFSKNQNNITKEKTIKENTQKTLCDLSIKKKLIKENEKKIATLSDDIQIFEQLRNVFKGIPENILRRLRPHIEQEGNSVVAELSDNEITALNIEEETLNVAATTNGEIQPIYYFSGGQRTRINLALRIAISRILSKLPQTQDHAYAVMQTLFIDEGDFGNLDEPGIRETVAIMRNLTQEFDRVIVISHVPTFKDMFQGQILQVIKNGAEISQIKTSRI